LVVKIPEFFWARLQFMAIWMQRNSLSWWQFINKRINQNKNWYQEIYAWDVLRPFSWYNRNNFDIHLKRSFQITSLVNKLKACLIGSIFDFKQRRL